MAQSFWLKGEGDGQRYDLLPEVAGLVPDWVHEKGSYSFGFEGAADAQPELVIAGVPWPPAMVRERPGEWRVIWRWEPGFYAGRVDLALRLGEHVQTWSVVTNPDKEKLEREQYYQMIQEILDEAATCFALSSFTESFRFGTERQQHPLLTLAFARQHLPQIGKLLIHLVENPHKATRRIHELVPAATAVIDEHAQEWLVSDGLSYLERVEDAAGLPGFPPGLTVRKIQVERITETTDTYENQVIYHFLARMQADLLKVHELLASKGDGQTIDKLLAAARGAEVKRYISQLEAWMDEPLFRSISPLRELRPPTTVLLTNPTYAALYKIAQRFHRAAETRDPLWYALELDQTWQLYEYWCFMMVVRCLREAELVEGTDDLFVLDQSLGKASLALRSGRRGAVRLKGGAKLLYKPNYGRTTKGPGSYTGTLEPDIALERYEGGKIQSILVLDPKYRVNPSTVRDGLMDLHKYRDGVWRFPDRVEIVHQGRILCPQEVAAVDAFDPSYQATYGLGALRLTPGDDKTMDAVSSFLLENLKGSPQTNGLDPAVQ